MAEDFDVEAMLEAPYNKDDNSSSKHRSDKRSDKYKEKDRDNGRRRSRSRERRRSRDKESRRSRDKDDKDRKDKARDRDKDRSDRKDNKNRERDRDRDRERDRERDRDRDRSQKDKDREHERDKEKRRSRDNERSREKEHERSRDKDRERSRDRPSKRERSHEREHSKDHRSKSRGLEPKLEELPPEERDLRTVFCMQLSQRIRAKDLEEFFSSVGKVRDVRLITCNKTRRFKGIAYIEFRDAESVPLALGLTGQKLLGIPIIVQHTQAEKNRVGNSLPNLAPKTSNGPTRLYVGSLHFNITEDMLRGIFEPFGKIDHIQLMTDPETGKSKGYGFLTKYGLGQSY